MNRVIHIGIILGVVILLFLIFSQVAYASVDANAFDQSAYVYYIDPGTGSIIIQVLIGALVGGIALIGVYRMRVKSFFTNLFSRRKLGKESDENKGSE